MDCDLCKYTTKVIMYYVGVSGERYAYGNYTDGKHTFRHPRGTVFYINADKPDIEELPKDDYPYGIEYKIEKKFLVCRDGRCTK